MTEFAHTYKDITEAEKGLSNSISADFLLIKHCKDFSIQTVDSNELPYIKSEDNAVSAAMFAISDYDESCDVYHYGEYYGTAEYVDMTPESWFDHMEVVFSMPY